MKLRQHLGYMTALLSLTLLIPSFARAESDDGKLRIIVFGGHPDDAEYKAGGTAVKWARLGHHVKLVSATNGDVSDQPGTKEEVAALRKAEVMACARKLGVTAQVLDIHDGEIEPTLETRKIFIRLIREWRADIVIGHRPGDYHPDHRAVGMLLQDASFLVTARRFCPEVPALKKMPVILFTSDEFTTPKPFTPTIAVALDDAFEQKLDGLHEIPSQVYGRDSVASARGIPPASNEAGRRNWLKKHWETRNGSEANTYRDLLIKLYGPEQGKAVKVAETFEISEYGHQPKPEEIKVLFPFFR
jgi:LmbE family N-acetylglucosaminyl deacetylase